MILPLLSSSFSSNSYLLRGGKTVVIDPGINNPALQHELEKGGLDYVILTHIHYDHLAMVPTLEKQFSPLVMASLLAVPYLERGDDAFTCASSFNAPPKKITVERALSDGEVIDLGKGLTLEVLQTPGHSLDSICLYCPKEKSLFSGDTIFADGIGRTDLPGGDWETLKSSLEKLLRLKKERGIDKIYPGHGPLGSGEDLTRVYELYFGK